LEDREISRLSGGEKQLVNVARAMIHDPELIIADEPTGNLDWENTQKIADLLMKFNKEGKTILLFTHDIHLLNYIKHSCKINLFKL
jgi:ABC-type lipoprotein export system ATPase subunit